MASKEIWSNYADAAAWVTEHRVRAIALRFDDRQGFVACGHTCAPAGAARCGAHILKGQFPWFGVNYVLRGRGVYRAGRGPQYPLMPGSLFQRLPGQIHTTAIDRASDYVEFHVALDARTYRALRALGAVRPNPPVRQIGLSEAILRDFLEFRACLLHSAPNATTEKLLAYQRLSARLYARGENLKSAAHARHQRLVADAQTLLTDNLARPLPMREAAERLGVGYHLLRKVFCDLSGVSLQKYQDRLRVEQACAWLQDAPPTAVAARLGFASLQSFSAWFSRGMSLSPRAYQRLIGGGTGVARASPMLFESASKP